MPRQDDDKTLPLAAARRGGHDDDRTLPANGQATGRDRGDGRTRPVLPAGMSVAPARSTGSEDIEIFEDHDGIHQIYPLEPLGSPCCALLVIIAGQGAGMSVPVSYGRTAIGSGANARLRLDLGDDQISAIHCIVSYDHEDRLFDIREADGATNFTRVNGARLASSTALNAGDVIRIGQTELRFIPVCGPTWDWADLSPEKR